MRRAPGPTSLAPGFEKVACTLDGGAAPGQAPSIELAPEFEAVSIKANKPAAVDPSRPETVLAGMPRMQGGPGSGSPGRIRYSKVPREN